MLLLALSACGGGGTGEGDGDVAEARDEADADALVDEATEVDAEVLEADAPLDAADGDEDGAIEGEAADDVAPDDVVPEAIDDGDADGPACEFMDLEWFLARCGRDWTYIRHFQRMSGDPALCPDYYEAAGERYPSLEAALAARSCDERCVFRPASAVMFVHCGSRMEYIAYHADDPSCPDIYEFPDGIYASVAEWEAANPCP